MKRLLFTISVLLILNGLNYNGKACTTFCIDNKCDLVFGRNYDWSAGFGHVTVNKRNIKKTALIQPPEKPIEWVSKYGSLTFNQGGREFPNGGINETGLVIEIMWLVETKYPEIDGRYGLEELQWIQYQLDNSSSVNDVLKSDSLVRVSAKSKFPIHFFVCDKYGNKATIEYLDGGMVVHTGPTLPISVLANDNYKKSIEYLETKVDLGDKDTVSFTSGSLERFTNAASMIGNYNNTQDIIDYSFDILDSVSQKKTQWSIVYDIKEMTVYYKTKNNPERKNINITELDFSCGTPSLFVNIDSDMVNQKIEFKRDSYQENRALIDSVWNKLKFLQSIPEGFKEALARYPETTKCNE